MSRHKNNIMEAMVQILQITVEFLFLLLQLIYHILLSLLSIFYSPTLKSVKGEIVLVTGGGHGIGKELSLLYASDGATVVVWDINGKNAEKTVEEIKKMGQHSAFSYSCDVANCDQVFATARKVQEEIGDVTILINNAGIMPTHPFLDHTKEEIERIMNINVLAHCWTLQAFLPTMKQNNYGHVVALSSSAGLVGLGNLAPYCASKFAVRGLMEGLKEEMRSDIRCQVKFTTICPYMVNTGLCKRPFARFEKLMALLDPKYVAREIMKAQKKNIWELTIPGYIWYLANITRLLPVKTHYLIRDFINAGVESDI